MSRPPKGKKRRDRAAARELKGFGQVDAKQAGKGQQQVGKKSSK